MLVIIQMAASSSRLHRGFKPSISDLIQFLKVLKIRVRVYTEIVRLRLLKQVVRINLVPGASFDSLNWPTTF